MTTSTKFFGHHQVCCIYKLGTPKFTCPRCGMTSYNPNDIREGYCGDCHDWTGKR